MGSFSKLKEIFEQEDDFALICHTDPDGDAIGALVALGEALRQRGKRVTLAVNDEIPAVFDFLHENIEIVREIPSSARAIILLDNGDFRRTGFQDEILASKKSGKKIINIDHHPKNDLWRVATINYVDEKASSTCQILHSIFCELGFSITSSIATALMAGIFYDTGGFQHQNTSEKVLEIASELLKKGAKLKKITAKLTTDRSIALFKLWGIALDRMTINQEFGITVSFLTRRDMEKSGANDDHVSGLIGLLNTTKESRAALLLYETQDGKIKGSFRTEDSKINLTKIADLLGGGGHRKAAGFSLTGRFEKTENGWKIV